jgi:hypothetical protein
MPNPLRGTTSPNIWPCDFRFTTFRINVLVVVYFCFKMEISNAVEEMLILIIKWAK